MSEENRLTRATRAAEDDLKCSVSYIKEGKVKALRTESGHRHREREREVRSMVEFKVEGLSQLFLSPCANGKN